MINVTARVMVNVITGVPSTPESENFAPTPGELPFKGFQYFDEADAYLYFGREDLRA